MTKSNNPNQEDENKILHLIASLESVDLEIKTFTDAFELYYIASLDETDADYDEYSSQEHQLAQSIVTVQCQLNSLKYDLEIVIQKFIMSN